MTRPISSTKSGMLVHCAWALAAGVAFAAGYFVSSPTAAERTVHAAPGQLLETGQPADGARFVAGLEPIAAPSGTPLTAEQTKAKAYYCLSERDPVAQMRQICELIPLITKDNWRGVLEAFTIQTTKDFRRPTAEWNFLLQHLGRVAGAEGVEESFTGKSRELQEQARLLLAGWAQSDPEKALAWFKAKDSDAQESLLGPFIAGLSKGDSGRTMELLEQFSKDDAKTHVNTVIGNAIQRDGFKVSEEKFRPYLHRASGPESLAGDVFRSLAQRRMSVDQVRGDPFATLDWFDSYLRPDSPAGPVTTSELVGAAASKDAVAAAKWVDERATRFLPEQEAPAFQAVAQAYARVAPDQFLAWMDQHQNSSQYDAIAQTAMVLLYRTGKVDAATAVIGNTQDPAKRLQLEQMLQKLKTPGKAPQFLEE